MTEEDIAKCKELCPQCAAGTSLRKRTDTGEWVHDNILVNNEMRSTSISHMYCLASEFRNGVPNG